MKNELNIGIIGAGNVGATTAFALLQKKMVKTLTLFDLNKNLLNAQIKDLQDCIFGIDKNIQIYSSTVQDMDKMDYVVITAGRNQLPGQTRDELYETNKKIVSELLKNLYETKNFKGKVILATNPVDRLAHDIEYEVISTGTKLDTYRAKFISEDETAYCTGEHGERVKVVAPNYKGDIEELTFKVRNRAMEIIDGKGNTAFGIATAISNIISEN